MTSHQVQSRVRRSQGLHHEPDRRVEQVADQAPDLLRVQDRRELLTQHNQEQRLPKMEEGLPILMLPQVEHLTGRRPTT